MEIRPVVEKPGTWELVTRRDCGCVFAWERIDGLGVIIVRERQECRACLADLLPFAVERGYVIRWPAHGRWMAAI